MGEAQIISLDCLITKPGLFSSKNSFPSSWHMGGMLIQEVPYGYAEISLITAD